MTSNNRLWRRITFCVLGIVLGIWLYYTPPGLLGKADAIGYAVCHRIEARSFHLGSRQLPLCARCSGMELGALLGIVFQIAQGRRGGMPPKRILAVFAIFALAFGVDGVNSYLHLFPGLPSLYEPANWLRLLTGSGLGIGLAAMLMPTFNQTVWINYDPRPAIDGFRKLGLLLLLTLVLDGMVLSENTLLLYPLAVLSAVGVLVLLGMAYSLVWLMVLKSENQYHEIKELIPIFAAGLIITLTQIGLMDLLRFIVTGTWAGFKL
jgi:uncharacterized membrane protein